MNDKPIGFFDSGIGGISLLKRAVLMLPDENFVYYGDSLNAPYGTKDEGEILRLTEKAVDLLLSHGIKALVLACNTVTSAAAKKLRETLSIPVIGIEPALKQAHDRHEKGRIIVMATEATLKQEKFRVLLEKYGEDTVCVPGRGIVELVEKGVFDGGEMETLLHEILDAHLAGGTESIVLGCTHYPFIAETISKVAGKHVVIVDGVEGTIRQLQKILGDRGISRNGGGGSVLLLNSCDADSTMELMKNLMQR